MTMFSKDFTIDPRRLRVLREVGLRGTVTSAASGLHLTPSAVSQQIAALSRDLGVPLLEKTGRGVRLTGQAQVILTHATVVQAQFERARADLAAFADGRTGQVSVAGFATGIAGLIAPAMRQLRTTRPGITVTAIEMEPPDASPASLRWIRQLACRAYSSALAGRPGPVHLNLPLREPLVLDGPLPTDPLPARSNGEPWVRPVPRPAVANATGRIEVPPRGVIVAGRLEHDGDGGRAGETAARLGWPLLADPLSGARHASAAIATYDLLLRDRGFAQRARPEMVVRVGDLPTSKPLRAWLASLDGVRQLAIDPDGTWQDPDAVVSERDDRDPGPALEALTPDARPDSNWSATWRAADDAAAATLAATLGVELSEPAVARTLGTVLGPEVALFSAASMPIRDLELYLPARTPLPRVLSNRGANGIDGTVSSAFGVAAAGDRPVVLLIGDVALAHDLGGLLAARRLGLELTIVVLNNDGGGIFHFLPISGDTDAFEQHIATPHGLRFEHAAALYGLAHERPVTTSELRSALARSVGSGQTTIIEIATDRNENVALHRRLADAALAAIPR